MGRRQRSAEPCDWELVVGPGRGWSTWARTPGRPEIAPGPAGELAAWATCGSERPTWFVVGDSADLHAQLPPRLGAVRWVSADAVHVEGVSADGTPAPSVRFGREDHVWKTIPVDCVPLGIDTGGATRLDGDAVPLLLLDDLGGDDRDEWVVEVPDSCGTARCDAVVYTPCHGRDLARPIGALDHFDGVEAAEERVEGWRVLRTAHAEGTDRWAVEDGVYRREAPGQSADR